jgi:hypothetical protein
MNGFVSTNLFHLKNIHKGKQRGQIYLILSLFTLSGKKHRTNH